MSKDQLLLEIEAAETKWTAATPEERIKIVGPFLNKKGLELFPKLRFSALPEILQLMLAMLEMPPSSLDDLAIKEGYLDFDSRIMLNLNIAVAAIAGSINRGSTATETSAYRRTGTTKWFKQGIVGPPKPESDDVAGTGDW